MVKTMPNYECGVPVGEKRWAQEAFQKLWLSTPKSRRPKWMKVARTLLDYSESPWRVWTTGSRKSTSVYLFAELNKVIVCCRISDHPRWTTANQRGCHHFFDGTDMGVGSIVKQIKRLTIGPMSGALVTTRRYPCPSPTKEK